MQQCCHIDFSVCSLFAGQLWQDTAVHEVFANRKNLQAEEIIFTKQIDI